MRSLLEHVRRLRWPLLTLEVLILFFGFGIVVFRHSPSPQPALVPISVMLDKADTHDLVSAQISDHDVIARDVAGHIWRSYREPDVPILNTLRTDGVTVTVRPFSNAGQIISALIFARAIVVLMVIMMRRNGPSGQLISFGKSRQRQTISDHSTVTFDDVAGVPEAKYELAEIVRFLKCPDKFHALGARIPKGILLVGPPGTGKTLIARAVAGEAGVSFFSLSGSEFVELFVGVGASRVRRLFREARKAAPCIVFIDEIDAVGRKRGSHATGGNEEREQTLNQLLVEMDGFDARTNIIVVGATNRPDILDSALLRPGRFDRQVTLDAPDVQGRAAILDLHARKKHLRPDVDLGVLARQTVGFTGADLGNLMNEAAILAARDDASAIGMQHLEESILRVVAGPERRSRLMSDHEKTVIAYHEVGHAIVMRSLESADPVRQVSIIARGQALGITVSTPKDDQRLITRKQLEAKMAAAMGGRVAEELMFDDVTSGASQDISYATSIARRMVEEFGMSDLGMVHIPPGDSMASIGLSEGMRNHADQEISRLVKDAYSTAVEILTRKRELLIAISEHLKDVETMHGDELDAWLQGRASVATMDEARASA